AQRRVRARRLHALAAGALRRHPSRSVPRRAGHRRDRNARRARPLRRRRGPRQARRELNAAAAREVAEGRIGAFLRAVQVRHGREPMIPELGHYALILALGVAMLQVILPIYGWRSRDAAALAAGPTAALTQGALVALAYFCLTWSFVHNDFSVLYVASNSHSELPLMYRITAVWGAHEGSILLWLLMLSGWSCAVVLAGRRLPADILGLVSAVLGLIGVGFLLFLLITSNPFARLVPAAAEGRDLNPLLQDPGMA